MKTKIFLIIAFLFTIFLPFAQSTDFSTPLKADFSQLLAPTFNNPEIEFYPNSNEDSPEKKCKFMKGCFLKGECYPRGYVKEYQVCFEKYSPSTKIVYSFDFINQSDFGEDCTNDFECKSNFCFDKKCVSNISSLLEEFISKISLLEDKLTVLQNELIEIQNITKEEGHNQIEETPKRMTGFFSKIFYQR